MYYYKPKRARASNFSSPKNTDDSCDISIINIVFYWNLKVHIQVFKLFFSTIISFQTWPMQELKEKRSLICMVNEITNK